MPDLKRPSFIDQLDDEAKNRIRSIYRSLARVRRQYVFGSTAVPRILAEYQRKQHLGRIVSGVCVHARNHGADTGVRPDRSVLRVCEEEQ